MIHIILFEPEIPNNTGSIIRLCANTGAQLHLIEPLGFALDDKKLRRAGLDYHEWAKMKIWPNLTECMQHLKQQYSIDEFQIFPMTTKGYATPYSVDLSNSVAFLMGPETRGLPQQIRQLFPQEHWLKLPMAEHSRSLNLANATSIIVYEAWRQQQFKTL